jgi:hypothetical protein
MTNKISAFSMDKVWFPQIIFFEEMKKTLTFSQWLEW